MTNQRNNPPKISIIMPSLNSVNFIERAIKSVVEQDYPNIELFIKDGGSVDGTLEIVKYYKDKFPKIINWESSKDRSQSEAINIGIKKTSGDILGYLNSDDVYKKGALKSIAEYFLENPDQAWVFGKCDIINSDDKKIRAWITSYKNFWMNFNSYQLLLVLNYISQMGVFWRREMIKKIGYFDQNEHYVMDYDYWLRLYQQSSPGKVNKELASFRISPLAKSSTGFSRQFDDEFRVAKKFTDNTVIIYLHFLHANMIKIIYTFIRILNTNRFKI